MAGGARRVSSRRRGAASGPGRVRRSARRDGDARPGRVCAGATALPMHACMHARMPAHMHMHLRLHLHLHLHMHVNMHMHTACRRSCSSPPRSSRCSYCDRAAPSWPRSSEAGRRACSTRSLSSSSRMSIVPSRAAHATPPSRYVRTFVLLVSRKVARTALLTYHSLLTPSRPSSSHGATARPKASTPHNSVRLRLAVAPAGSGTAPRRAVPLKRSGAACRLWRAVTWAATMLMLRRRWA